MFCKFNAVVAVTALLSMAPSCSSPNPDQTRPKPHRSCSKYCHCGCRYNQQPCSCPENCNCILKKESCGPKCSR